MLLRTNSFIYSFTQETFVEYIFVSNTVLASWAVTVNKIDKYRCYLLVGETDSEKKLINELHNALESEKCYIKKENVKHSE